MQSARIGNIEFPVDNSHFFGLIAYIYRIYDCRRFRVEFIYGTQNFSITPACSYIRADIGIIAVEADETAVGYIYVGDMFGTVGCHDFYFVRTVHDGI